MSGFIRRFTPEQITGATLALQLWSDVANITYTRVGSGTSGEAAYSDSANLLLGDWTTGNAVFPMRTVGGTWRYQISGGNVTRSSAVWIDGTVTGDIKPLITNGGIELLIHEIGHSLSLAHPGDYNVAPGVTATYAADAVYLQDSQQYTAMSYFGETNTGANFRRRIDDADDP